MKIGIFDSGLGGLQIARSVRAALPQYDYIYLGDTLHVPYGSRSAEAIYGYTKAAMEYLFAQDCQIIIVACNTASAAALRRLQQEYLAQTHPDRRILGVIIPMLEKASDSGLKRFGLIGTDFIVHSDVYAQELGKIDPDTELFSQATPLFVPLLENGGETWLEPVLKEYLAPLLAQHIDALILGCTHYALFKPVLERILPPGIAIFSQDEIIPAKLADYLARHPEQAARLGKGGSIRFCLTDCTKTYDAAAQALFGETLAFEKVEL